MSTLDFHKPLYRLLTVGGYHLSTRWNDYWRSTPLINKLWFSLIRGWQYMGLAIEKTSHHQFFLNHWRFVGWSFKSTPWSHPGWEWDSPHGILILPNFVENPQTLNELWTNRALAATLFRGGLASESSILAAKSPSFGHDRTRNMIELWEIVQQAMELITR